AGADSAAKAAPRAIIGCGSERRSLEMRPVSAISSGVTVDKCNAAAYDSARATATPTAEAATSRSTRARVSGVRCQFTHPISTPSQEEISDTQSDSSEASVKVAVKSMVALYTGARRLPSLFHQRSARIARRVLVQSATDPTVC